MTSNRPAFTDFIAEKVGTRFWYTRPHAAPVKSRGRTYIKPAIFRAIEDEYESLFGVSWRRRSKEEWV